MPSEPITWTAILTWIISGLLVVSAFFLVRFFNAHDENMKKNAEIQDRILFELGQHSIALAVHGEKHDQHDERLERLEHHEARRKS